MAKLDLISALTYQKLENRKYETSSKTHKKKITNSSMTFAFIKLRKKHSAL